jgi:hypothetical protein
MGMFGVVWCSGNVIYPPPSTVLRSASHLISSEILGLWPVNPKRVEKALDFPAI